MPNHQTEVDFNLMEAPHSSPSSYNEAEYESPKVELVDNTTARNQNISTAATGGYQAQENTMGSKSEVFSRADSDDMAMLLRRKVNELGGMRVPELQMSGCSDVDEETVESDDDLCSASDDDNEEPYNPLASGIMPPVLPDIQLRVPMEDANDARRVKDALLIKGVLDVVIDEERQMVTVTGIVPPIRVLKKIRKVKPQARIISTVSPFAVFINPNFHCSQFEVVPNSSNAIDIPTPHTIPNFVVHQQRPRPAFQRYNFHNDPHSPFLRTFSPTDLSPANSSPSTAAAFHHHSWLDSSL